ncbi:MAG: hypothetical protein V2A74_03575, partial [bacterium]
MKPSATPGLLDLKHRSMLLALGMICAVLLQGGSAWAAFGFGPPAALNSNAATDSSYDQSPQVTTDGAGNWVAVWSSDNSLGGTIGPDFDILVARS